MLKSTGISQTELLIATSKDCIPTRPKFIAEIPRTLLELLPVPAGTAVLDPFCGSGSTLVECQKREMLSIGIDLNPIACLISRVKTGPVPDGIDQSIDQSIDQTVREAHRLKTAAVPNIPNLDHWFKEPIQEALASITTAIGSARPKHRDILRLALSSIIVRVSNQDSDTRYAAVPKNVHPKDVYSGFAAAACRITQVLTERTYGLAPAQIIEADTLALTPSDIGTAVGLVITSPPYPNAYEYWLYHKYRMWWLGFDPIAVKQHEIGARAHFFKRNHHTAKHFVDQMGKTFELLQAVVVPVGFVCFVVGRSKIHGEIVDNAAIIERVAANVGFSRCFKTERAILPNRKSFNLSHANIKTETLLVLRRHRANR